MGPHMSHNLVSFLLALWRVLVEVREKPRGSVTADTFKDSEVSSNTCAGFGGWRDLAVSGQARGHFWKVTWQQAGRRGELWKHLGKNIIETVENEHVFGGIPTLQLEVPSLFPGAPQGAQKIGKPFVTTHTGIVRSIGEETQSTFWGLRGNCTQRCRKATESVLPLGAGPRLACCDRLCCATPPSLTTTPSPDWVRPTQEHLPSTNSGQLQSQLTTPAKPPHIAR